MKLVAEERDRGRYARGGEEPTVEATECQMKCIDGGIWIDLEQLHWRSNGRSFGTKRYATVKLTGQEVQRLVWLALKTGLVSGLDQIRKAGVLLAEAVSGLRTGEQPPAEPPRRQAGAS
jgi:hypothetical protein